MNNDDQPPKNIPSNFDDNDVSPTEDKIVRIYKDGNVDFFIKCGGLGYKKECIYYKFSFKVDQNIYNDDYGTVEKIVDVIQGTQINELTVSILRPKLNLDCDYHIYMKDKTISNIKKTTIKDILDDMKDIGAGSWAIAMVNFLIKNGLKKEATELFNQELNQELLEKNKGLEKLLEKNKDLKQLFEKNQELERQLKEKQDLEQELEISKDSEQLLKEKQDLEQELEKNEEKIVLLLNETSKNFEQKLKEKQDLEQKLKNNIKNEYIKKTNINYSGLYRVNDGLFSCCYPSYKPVNRVEDLIINKEDINVNNAKILK